MLYKLVRGVTDFCGIGFDELVPTTNAGAGSAEVVAAPSIDAAADYVRQEYPSELGDRVIITRVGGSKVAYLLDTPVLRGAAEAAEVASSKQPLIFFQQGARSNRAELSIAGIEFMSSTNDNRYLAIPGWDGKSKHTLYGYCLDTVKDGLVVATYSVEKYEDWVKKARDRDRAKKRKAEKLVKVKKTKARARSVLKPLDSMHTPYFIGQVHVIHAIVDGIIFKPKLYEGWIASAPGDHIIRSNEHIPWLRTPGDYNVASFEYWLDEIMAGLHSSIYATLATFSNDRIRSCIKLVDSPCVGNIGAHLEVFERIRDNLKTIREGGREVSDAVLDDWMSKHSENRVMAQRKVDREKFQTLLTGKYADIVEQMMVLVEWFLRWLNEEEFLRPVTAEEWAIIEGAQPEGNSNEDEDDDDDDDAEGPQEQEQEVESSNEG